MTPLLWLVLAASPADEAAAGTRALNAGDRATAAVHFRTALKTGAPQPVHNASRHGLALCLIAADPPDWKQALPLLHPPAEDGNYPDRGACLELLGVGYRARAKDEGDGRRWDAHRWYSEAARWFTDKKRPADAARCRCAAAELDLLLNNPQAARAATEGFLKDRAWAATPSGGRGLHIHALACLKLNDPATAERAAGRVASTDPAFAEAQVVLGRVRQLAGDASDAAALFAAAGDRPDARFHRAMLAFEAGRFPEALSVFQQLTGDDAGLWIGATLVRLGRSAEAVAVLDQLKPTAPHLPDQVARWLGEAQLGLGRTTDALSSHRAATDLVGKVPEHLDPAVRERRHDTRFALADVLLRTGQAGEAADLFRRVWDEGGRSKRRDELLARMVAAYRLADKPDQADSRAVEFRRMFLTSPHLAAVARHQAEIAVSRSLAVGPEPHKLAERRAKTERAIDLCQAPELANDPAAEVGLANVLRQAARFTEAAEAVRGVPAARLMRGDCLLRAGDIMAAADELAGADTPASRLALGHAFLAAGRWADARNAFAALIEHHPDDPDVPRARADRALASYRAGDQKAVDELGKTWDVSAATHLAAILEQTDRPDEAAGLLKEARDRLSGERDEAKHLLAYRHGLAFLACDRPAEARAIFEPLAGQLRGRPGGAAFSRRAGECRLIAAEAALREKSTDATRNAVREAAEELVRRAEELRDQPGAEAFRPHLYLLAARTLRTLAAGEVERAWEQEKRHRRHQWADRGTGPPPVVSRRDVPMQGAERRAVDIYRRLAEELPTTPHAVAARLEAAAVVTERDDHLWAQKLLDAGDAAASGEWLARQRVALADTLTARKLLPAAAESVDGIADPVAADRLAALRLAFGEPLKAVESCGSEPSLRLGESLAAVGRLEPAAAVFARLEGPAAEYGAGWVAAKRGRLDEAVKHLGSVRDGRAKLLLGLLLVTQGKRDEGVVTLLSIRTGDAVEWAARLEACRLLGDEAGLRRLCEELPTKSEWGVAASQRLSACPASPDDAGSRRHNPGLRRRPADHRERPVGDRHAPQ